MPDDTKLREWAQGTAENCVPFLETSVIHAAGASLVRRCAEIARQAYDDIGRDDKPAVNPGDAILREFGMDGK